MNPILEGHASGQPLDEIGHTEERKVKSPRQNVDKEKQIKL